MEVLASRTENKLMLTLFLEYFKDNKFTDKLKFITHYKHDISGKWKLTIFWFIYYSSIPRLPPKQHTDFMNPQQFLVRHTFLMRGQILL